MVRLTERFVAAVSYLNQHCGRMRRKGDGTPYTGHCLAVAARVLEAGGDEDAAIGALLHDVAEDCGGEDRLAEIAASFGEVIAQIVRECSDALPAAGESKAPWRQRKEHHIAALPEVLPATRLVIAADKLHNLRSLANQYRQDGPALWANFRAGRDESLWYYRSMAEGLRRLESTALTEEVVRTYQELAALAANE